MITDHPAYQTKLVSTHFHTQYAARIGCENCGDLTTHLKERRQGVTVYRCEACNHEIVRTGEIA